MTKVKNKYYRKLTLPLEFLAFASNLILGVPPCVSTRLISSIKSGANRIIMAKASGLLPVTRLKVSSTDWGASDAVAAEVRFRGFATEPAPAPPPPSERRPEGRWEGGRGKEEGGRFPPAPRPAPPPARPSLDGPPYIVMEERDEDDGRWSNQVLGPRWNTGTNFKYLLFSNCVFFGLLFNFNDLRGPFCNYSNFRALFRSTFMGLAPKPITAHNHHQPKNK